MQNNKSIEEVIFEPVSFYRQYDHIIIDSEFKKYVGVMPCYSDGTITEIPATYGFVEMLDDKEYWNNVLEWDYVKKRKELTKYIKSKLLHQDINDTIFLGKELFEDGGVFSNPKNYRKLMQSLLSYY